MRVENIIAALNNPQNNKDEIVEAGPQHLAKYIGRAIKSGLLPHEAATWIVENKKLRESTISKLKDVPQVTKVRIPKIKQGGVNYLEDDVKKHMDDKE